MERVNFRLSEAWVTAIDEAVDAGRFPSRSEAMRHAIREEFGPLENDTTDVREQLGPAGWGEADV